MSTLCQRVARVSTEKKAARVSVPKSVQLFICVLFGMANMICYGHYKDSDMRGEAGTAAPTSTVDGVERTSLHFANLHHILPW